MKTRDIDIRRALNSYIHDKFSYDITTRIIHELNICYGCARVDIAAVNGSFYGYEIKSDSDTLDRLPKQVDSYNKVFDYMNLVCCEKFAKEAENIIPKWWGIYIASIGSNNSVEIKCIRGASLNKNVDPFSLAQFLWKDEVANKLKKLGADNKIYRFPKYVLWNQLAESCPIDELKLYVRNCLKQRDNWRPDSQ